MTEIEEYFNECVGFWMSQGLSRGAATVRAIWWDCVEVWNAGRSWNKNKTDFVNRYRRYEPYGLVPEAECVRSGNA